MSGFSHFQSSRSSTNKDIKMGNTENDSESDFDEKHSHCHGCCNNNNYNNNNNSNGYNCNNSINNRKNKMHNNEFKKTNNNGNNNNNDNYFYNNNNNNSDNTFAYGKESNFSKNMNNNNYSNYNKNQILDQKMLSMKEELQREQVVSQELLINATKEIISVVSDYGDRIIELKDYEKEMINNNNKNKNNNKKDYDKLKTFCENCNIKSIAGLTLFEMQVDAFKTKTKKRGLNEKIGIKNSAKIIDEFLMNVTQKLINNNNNNNNEIGFIIDRIMPFTNAMKSVLNGNKLPEMKELSNVNFESNTTNNVLSKVLGATSHTIPNRIENVKKNYKDYQLKHEQNIKYIKNESDNEDNENNNNNNNKKSTKKFSETEANNLYRDIKRPMQKQRTKEEMDKRAMQDLERDRRTACATEPNLF